MLLTYPHTLTQLIRRYVWARKKENREKFTIVVESTVAREKSRYVKAVKFTVSVQIR